MITFALLSLHTRIAPFGGKKVHPSAIDIIPRCAIPNNINETIKQLISRLLVVQIGPIINAKMEIPGTTAR